MLKKFLFFNLIILILTSCGYSPMLSDNTNLKFGVTSYEFSGNRQINNLIESKLSKFLTNSNDKRFKIKIKTNQKSISTAKDTTGRVTNLKIITNLELTYIKENLENDNQEKTITFSESLNIIKNENNYEQDKYEKIVIENMSELLFNKLTLFLSRVQ